MSLAKLNELLDRALQELHQDGLSVVTYQEPKPWLPESYWAEVAADQAATAAQQLIDLAKHATHMKHERARADAHLAKQDAATVMAEWDESLPTLQGSSEVLARAGWGRHRMREQMWRGNLRPRTAPDAVQPVYNNVCQFCHRPITAVDDDTWKDHGGKRICPDRYDGQYDADHVPEGVEVDDEWDEG